MCPSIANLSREIIKSYESVWQHTIPTQISSERNNIKITPASISGVVMLDVHQQREHKIVHY
jgi:hypothetical protein